MAKYRTRKKVTPSFSNFSNYDTNLMATFKCYTISCKAYSVDRVTLSGAEEIAHKMLQWYPEVWITTPEGLKINVADGTTKDLNEGTDNSFNFEKFESVKK